MAIPFPRDPNRVPITGLQDSVANAPIGWTGLALGGIEAGTVAIVDGSGVQITSFGGGTQYTDGGTPPENPVGPTLEWNESGTWRTVSTANPLPVTATFSPSGTQDVNLTKVGGSDVALGQALAAASLPVVLTAAQITTLTPPAAITGFALDASLTTLNTSVNTLLKPASTLAAVTTVSTVTNLSKMNGVALLMGNGVTGTGSQRVTVASDNTPFPIKIDQTTPGTTNAISIAQIGGTTVVDGGLAGSQSVGGTVATNVAITDNPVNMGGQAVSSENSAVTTARKVQFVADLVGKQIVLPYANPENFVSGTATATDTTSTSLVASPGGSLRNYITQITVWNASAVNTYIKIQDGTGGTTLYAIPAPAGGGATLTLPTPLRQPTTATAIFFAANASANAVFVSASGYKGL